MKPNYNTVDFIEVELADSNGTFRNNDSVLLQVRLLSILSLFVEVYSVPFFTDPYGLPFQMRREIIERSHNYRSFDVRIPQDDFVSILFFTSRVYDFSQGTEIQFFLKF